MHTNTRMHVRTLARTYPCTNASKHAWTCTYTKTHVLSPTHTQTHTSYHQHIHKHTHPITNTYTDKHVHGYGDLCQHVRTHAPMPANTHAHVCIHTELEGKILSWMDKCKFQSWVCYVNSALRLTQGKEYWSKHYQQFLSREPYYIIVYIEYVHIKF